jgi:hypothetical protein
MAQTPTRRIWGGAGDTGIAGRLEHISPLQGFGTRGMSFTSTTVGSPARTSDERPFPVSHDNGMLGTSWEEHWARADSGTTTNQTTNARSVPDQYLIDRPRIADLIEPPTPDASGRPSPGRKETRSFDATDVVGNEVTALELYEIRIRGAIGYDLVNQKS